VVDSFAGGGSIPLEALRVGSEAFANDLNPIPALICQVLLEDVPRYGSALRDALDQEVPRLNSCLYDGVALFYPQRTSDEEPTAYLWARLVQCEAPHCGAAIPLLRSLWLSRGAPGRSALRVSVERPMGKVPTVVLTVYEPQANDQVGNGTVSGGRAVCPACSIPLLRSAIESQLKVQHGGTDYARLIAVMVATPEGRRFRIPAVSDFEALERVRERDAVLREAKSEDGMSLYPNERINPVRPSPNARGLSAVRNFPCEARHINGNPDKYLAIRVKRHVAMTRTGGFWSAQI
jgi:putative DNA methylase